MLSLFTPTHHGKYLADAYTSLREQTDPDWEWVVLHNNGSHPFACDDSRVKQYTFPKRLDWVGPLKAAAVDLCKGDLLMEFDHDDLLMPTAVAACKEAFADESVGFVYSNALHCDGELKPTRRFGDGFGWQYREQLYRSQKLHEPVTPDASPASLSRIWFSPNHFRAFRRQVYEKIGGYAKDMRVLDDQDLMCRMYLATEMHHIDSAQYVYRVHGENAWLKHNAEIQNNTLRLHDVYAEAMACTWAQRKGLRRLDLGGAIAPKKGYETVDRAGANINCDLNARWPFEDSSVGVIRAMDVFEHLRDPLHVMVECYRVLAPGGWIFAQVPSTDGRGAFQDPTHVSFWNENSWLYYTHANWARYIGTPVRFQAPRVYTTNKDERGVCWTRAHLICLKDGHTPPGKVEI